MIMGRFGGNGAEPRHLRRRLYRWRNRAALPEFFKASGFRAAFEDKGRFRDYVHDIPVYMITHDQPGLLGAGAHLRQTLGRVL